MGRNKSINSASSTSNIRKVNSSRFPKGCVYILKKENEDLYKIGVSQNPARRIRDIKAILPFEVDIIFISSELDKVYDLEFIIHKKFKDNNVRKEWFNIYEEDIVILINILKDGV